MKISGLHDERIILESALLLEAGYGRIIRFNYDAFRTDANPIILYLGKWRSKRTGNTVVGGVNMNYLSDEQIKRLRENLRELLRAGRTLKARWRKGHELLPDIFPGKGGGRGAYRTYQQDMIHTKSTSTITPIDKPEKKEPKTPTKAPRISRAPSAPSRISTGPAAPPAPTKSKEKPRKKLEKPLEKVPEAPDEPDEPEEPDEAPTRASKEPEETPEADSEAPARASEEPEEDPEPDITVDDVGRAVDLKQNETGIGPKAKEKKPKK